MLKPVNAEAPVPFRAMFLTVLFWMELTTVVGKLVDIPVNELVLPEVALVVEILATRLFEIL
jgi:hypothetical protein